MSSPAHIYGEEERLSYWLAAVNDVWHSSYACSLRRTCTFNALRIFLPGSAGDPTGPKSNLTRRLDRFLLTCPPCLLVVCVQLHVICKNHAAYSLQHCGVIRRRSSFSLRVKSSISHVLSLDVDAPTGSKKHLYM